MSQIVLRDLLRAKSDVQIYDSFDHIMDHTLASDDCNVINGNSFGYDAMATVFISSVMHSKPVLLVVYVAA